MEVVVKKPKSDKPVYAEIYWANKGKGEIYVMVPSYKWVDEEGKVRISDLYIYLEPIYDDDGKIVDVRLWQQFCVSPEDPKYDEIPPSSECDDGRDVELIEIYEELRHVLEVD